MTRKTADEFEPDLLILFDAYVHGHIDRRGFLEKAGKFAANGVTATMLLDSLNPNFGFQQVQKDDKRIRAEYVDYPSPTGNGKGRGYLVRHANATARLPGIVVIHENRGLNPHIEDIARRLAVDNFVAFAPDALAPLGGYPASGEDEARALFQKLDQAKTREDMVAAAEFLKGRPECTGRLGTVGFCWGGGIVNLLATRLPDLRAAVPFYGAPAPTADVPKIKAALLVHYAENDQGINARRPDFEAALKAAGTRYEMHVYPGTQHGFNNDTTPRYNEVAAKEAWDRTVKFFNAHVRQ